MDNYFENIKRCVVNFKLARCCFVFPLRTGILIIGYFNIFVSVILIIGTVSDSFMPTIKHIQDMITEDQGSKATCILVPVTELAFGVLMLCGMHRNDVVLLRFFMLYAIAATGISLVVYSFVIAIVDILYIFIIVASILYQAYMVLLVRSAIVDINLRTKVENNGTMYYQSSGIYPRAAPDVETPEQPKEQEVVTVDVKKTEFNKMGDNKIEEKKPADITIEEKTENNKLTAEKSDDKKLEDKNLIDKKSEDKQLIDKKSEDKNFIDKKSEDRKLIDKKSEGKKLIDKKSEDDKNKEEKRDKREAKTKVETVNEKKLQTIEETPKVTVKDTPKSK